mgnify:CR=1 FL=1
MSEFNNLNIRVDKTLKNDAENVLDEFGISMTTAITMFLKQVVREQGIPFDLHLGTPNAETLAAMGEFYEMKKHPEKYKRYKSCLLYTSPSPRDA